MVLLVKFYLNSNEQQPWPESQATISWQQVEKYQDKQTATDKEGNKTTRLVDLQRITFGYSFKVEDNAFDGFFKIDGLKNDSEVQDKLNLYKKGQAVTIKYAAADPLDNTLSN